MKINQIDYIKRLGRPIQGKTRPLLISFIAQRIKYIIFRQKDNLILINI